MSKVLIIGAGGVGGVVTHKCAQLPEVFSEIVLASRNEDKCKAIAAQLSRPIRTAQVDADNVPELTTLLNQEKPDLVINVALPYQDLTIMDACLAAGVDYLDTANYEPLDTAKFEYSWQWAYREKFEKAGLMALLGSGFDPGATNVFTAYWQNIILMKSMSWTLLMLMVVITVIRLPPTLIRKSTSAKSRLNAGIGKMVNLSPPRRCRKKPALPARKMSAAITFTGCITRSWNPWSSTSRP